MLQPLSESQPLAPKKRKMNGKWKTRRRTTPIQAMIPLLVCCAAVRAQQDCDYESDICHYQFDGECDAGVVCDEGTDCFDCSECNLYSYDCDNCVKAGCYWCPGDAKCSPAPIGTSVWDMHPLRQPACRLETDWQQQCTPNATNFFTDPLYDSMKWIYQLIRLEEAWALGFTGTGVHVRINDDGVDVGHPEFAANIDAGNNCVDYLPVDPLVNKHGTACASIVAGGKNNGQCAVGIAPDVKFSSCNGPAILQGATELFMTHLEVVDVISNSWGPLPCTSTLAETHRRLQEMKCPFDPSHEKSPCSKCGTDSFDQALTKECEEAIIKYCSEYYELDPVACGEYLDLYVSCAFHALDPTNEEGFPKVMAQGRGGLGPIITFAGGNDYKIGVDSNGDGMINSRYTIGVAAVGKDGLHASYSTVGASIFLAAPGGDEEALSNNIVANPGGGCHDITIGTSFATPVVSGVAALMLQANPKLGWRDVQGVLEVTSKKVDFEDESWFTNQAGVSHSYKYGFGLIDAAAAVELSQKWVNWDTEKQIMVESGAVDIGIPDATVDDSAYLSTSLTITQEDVVKMAGTENVAMESVVIYLDLLHGSRGDLEIILISPQGTQSLLAPGKRPENTILGTDQRWKLMTLRHWGENPVGSWSLLITDQKTGVISECVNIPWEFFLADEYYTCTDLAAAGITDCNDPSQMPPSLAQGEFNNLTPLDACCACGGGLDTASIDQKLKSWKILAYGHTAVSTERPISTPPTPVNATLPTSMTQTPTPVQVATERPIPAPTTPVNATLPSSTTQTPSPVQVEAPTQMPMKACGPSDTLLLGESGTLNIDVPDAGEGIAVSTIAVSDPRQLEVGKIEVFLEITHQSFGDLKVTLTSPGGTDAILANGDRPVGFVTVPKGEPWTFSTCDVSGAAVNGTWTLSIEDMHVGIQSECVDKVFDVSLEQILDCSSFTKITDCSSASQANQSAILTTRIGGGTPLDACCVCGGGTDVTGVTNVLKSWNITLHSQSIGTTAPTPSSTTAGSANNSSPTLSAGSPIPTTIASTANTTVGPTAAPQTSPVGPQAPAPNIPAFVITIAPNVTNLPFITSGASEDLRMSMTRRSLFLLGISVTIPCFLSQAIEVLCS